MTTIWRATPGLCATAALLSVVFAALGLTGSTAVIWRAILATAMIGILSICLQGRPYRLVLAFVLGVSGARAVVQGPAALAGPIGDAAWAASILDLVFGLVLIGGILLVVRARRGGLGRRELLDGSIASLGAAAITWIAVVVPALEHDANPTLMVVASAHLPISIILLMFTVDLYLDGMAHNSAMRYLLLAVTVNLGCSSIRALVDIEAIGSDWTAISGACHLAALLLLFAAAGHPSARMIWTPIVRRQSDHNREAIRVAPIVLCLGAPAALMALVPPTSALDTTLRIVATMVGTAALIARLVMASRTIAQAQSALRERLHTDELTELATRGYFLDRVTQDLDRTWRTEFRPTITQFNIDRFKNINDGLGHDAAGQVLFIIARRLDAFARAFGGVAGRIGGDEFAILDASVNSTSQAIERAERALQLVREPVLIGGSRIFVTASVGVAVAARNRTVTAESLAGQSMIATHRAKATGRDRVAVFDDSMQAEITRRMDVEHALHGAIARHEMRLYQQPIVDIATGHLSGFESLIRWERSPDEIVLPADFISIAEETGMIKEIGRWAIHEALSELRRWIDDGIAAPTTTISVNVSPRQIADPDFPNVVRLALDATGVPAHLFWIEVTESMMIDDPEVAQRTLREVRAMGVRIALDDFGTGYSSLSLLQQFPIQRIKIDRAFVSGIADRANDRSLVHTIIAMAQSIGLDLVAEGVETVHQLQSLRELGCDKAQGFLISRPLPSAALPSTIAALAELADLAIFQPAFDTTKPLHLPDMSLDNDHAATSDTASWRRDGVSAGWHPSEPIGRPHI